MPQPLAGSASSALPLRGGPFLFEATGIWLGNLEVLVGRHSLLLLRGVVPVDRVWAVFPITPFRINGRCAAPPMRAMLGCGRRVGLCQPCRGGLGPGIPAGGAGGACTRPPGRSPRLGLGAQVMPACDPEVWLRSIQLLQSAVEATTGDAAVFEVAEARRSSILLLEMPQDLLTGISRGLRPRILRLRSSGGDWPCRRSPSARQSGASPDSGRFGCGPRRICASPGAPSARTTEWAYSAISCSAR